MAYVYKQNDLYLAVLPLVHITPTTQIGYGLTEQALTLFPDRNFATEFFEHEVDAYIEIFKQRANKYLIGGHVTSYDFYKEPARPGHCVVRVTQHVS